MNAPDTDRAVAHYGAESELARRLVELRKQRDELLAALRDLIYCKNLKDEESRRRQRRDCSRLRGSQEERAVVNEMRDEYNRLKPVAWAQARAAIAAVEAAL